MFRTIFVVFLALIPYFLIGQNFDWWAQRHNWDGVTHWTKYINVAANSLGPNALPVPDIKNGQLDSIPYFEFGIVHHRSKGDITSNLNTTLHLPLFDKRIALRVWLVPIESYKLDQETQIKRSIRTQDGEGIAGGDIYIASYFQLLLEQRHGIDLLMTINLRTASGTQLKDARFSDTPGYFLDLSAGKSFILAKTKLRYWRIYSMSGLYVYQTYLDNNRQNDAFLYGLGTTVAFNKISFHQQIGGYIGYLNNGDRPLVLRSEISTNLKAPLNYRLTFQQGFIDFPYTSFWLSAQFNLNKILHLSDDQQK